MKTVRVSLKTNPYRVRIGHGMLSRASTDFPKTTRAFILADSRLKKQARTLAATLKKSGTEVTELDVTASEECEGSGLRSLPATSHLYPVYSAPFHKRLFFVPEGPQFCSANRRGFLEADGAGGGSSQSGAGALLTFPRWPEDKLPRQR